MPGSTDANFSDNFSNMSYVKPKRKCPTWLYNSSTKEVLGRTGKSWFLILLFYCIYYALLAGFFIGMMMINLTFIIPEDVPLRTGYNSLLALNPGLGMRPNVNIKNTLIKFSAKDEHTYRGFVQNIDAYLDEYLSVNQKESVNFADCSKPRTDVEKVCKFDLKQLGPCSSDKKYGYPEGKPCVILKLNKIYGWLPDIADDAPTQSPQVNCTGQNPHDSENMGKIIYAPGDAEAGTFSSSFFPFLGQKSYLSPIVAVQFPNLKKSVTVMVECTIKNLKGGNIADSVKFELLVD